MNKQVGIEAAENVAVSHKTIAIALASAQLKMGKALKSTNNPQFKSKYADLGSVVDACMPSLNDAGIAVIQPTTDDETGRYVETVLIHGVSGETLKCRVPLIVGKNDMQGYGSAVTYARRYGLMSMAGIAPEDDDGNAASKSPPFAERKATLPAKITQDQFASLKAQAEAAGVDEATICERAGVDHLHEVTSDRLPAFRKLLQEKIDAKRPSDTVSEDEIPY